MSNSRNDIIYTGKKLICNGTLITGNERTGAIGLASRKCELSTMVSYLRKEKGGSFIVVGIVQETAATLMLWFNF